nr:unnamed protein product [Digitaria exilis]
MGADKADNCVASGHGRTVCVTGAGGFIASWLVKLLLEKGYMVCGTVRNPDDEEKNAHLRALDGAAERLTLVRADLLDKESLAAAFRGCEGVFHTASPVTDDPKMIEPAVNGTKNVINAAADVATLRRVVFTSSIGTVYMGSHHAPGAVVDEKCWSDLEYCKNTKSYVHVKDVAEAHARVYEEPTACGRYLCAGRTLHRGEVCRILAKLFPEYPVPTECKGGCRFSSRRLAELGVGVTPASLCLYDTVTSLQGKGLFPRRAAAVVEPSVIS